MEIFDHKNICKRQPLVKFIYIWKFMLIKMSWNDQKYCTPSNTCQGVTGNSLRCFWASVENRRTFHRHHAVSITTTHLSCKDCLTGYWCKKVAVISEHHTPAFLKYSGIFQDHSAEARVLKNQFTKYSQCLMSQIFTISEISSLWKSPNIHCTQMYFAKMYHA